MEQIKTSYAIGITREIALFGRPLHENTPATYFLGWRRDYCGPRDPRYKTEGAHYDGAIIAEIPANIARCLPGVEANKNNPEWLKFFDLSDIITAAEIYGICEAMTNGGNEFANIEI